MTTQTRRTALQISFGACAAAMSGKLLAAEQPSFRLATFSADVTPRLGHPLLGGHLMPARSIDDPLFAKGLVLIGGERPIVLVAVDWCEIRNDAYARWREVLAEAADTSPERVLLTSVHQHDAPLADLAAQRLLIEASVPTSIIDPDFHERTVQRVATALRQSVAAARPVTHYGTGQAKVDRVASNRRVVDAQGRSSFARGSTTRDPALRELPEGQIDPWLKALTFYDREEPLATISAFATHPMSYYGGGAISSDFVGLARARRQKELLAVHQIYVSGCSGDITAGKFNEGTPEHRTALTERMQQAMAAAFAATTQHSMSNLGFRAVPMVLPHREGMQSEASLRARLADAKLPPFERALAALGLSSRLQHPAGHAIDVCAIDLGGAKIVLLPGESLVGYQLMAQQLLPEVFVMAIGYGECAPGYIPTAAADREGYADSQGWCWVAPGAEPLMRAALRQALQ